ncbi:DNA-binding transcriptional ArsR family regulator [Pseudonocardia sediminis]|uniref:DNA-binding transcriptional ArsR family regulator n=1 Tax=Pseudonocardia sediminis TaxID=1397368 RepID=A0A4Q7UX03_PSEST|nr:helix-turn-helix transcriptional regulator [Pseudonocardia sediminis]RZT85614.1 DNA-binding transcriptional ArsR family regulator [Pseudonocardia sediminis]
MSAEECALTCLDLPKAEAVRLRLVHGPVARIMDVRSVVSADPVRLRLGAALALGVELCVCDLIWACEVPRELVMQHLRSLCSRGLATSHRGGTVVAYRLTPMGRLLMAALLSSDDESGAIIVAPPAGEE